MAKKQRKEISPEPPKILPIDIHYKYWCNYETVKDCILNRCHEDVCRCGKIENAKIEAKEIDIEKILPVVISACKQFVSKDNLTDIDKYCLDRILVHHKMYDVDKWYIKIESGYYGEEINGIVPQNEVYLNKDLMKFLSLQSNKEKIEFVLLLEYECIYSR